MADPDRGIGRAAVLGFRPHTYWTAAVALGGEAGAPKVIARRRIDFAAGDERSVYHHVEGMAPDDAEAWIARVWTATLANTTRAVSALIRDLADTGVTFSCAVVPVGRAKVPEALADILKSHSHMHAAEGDFYRGVVAQACGDVGLEVRRAIERNLAGLVCTRFALPATAVDDYLVRQRAALGPPWTEDQKLAMLAAWSAMEAPAA